MAVKERQAPRRRARHSVGNEENPIPTRIDENGEMLEFAAPLPRVARALCLRRTVEVTFGGAPLGLIFPIGPRATILQAIVAALPGVQLAAVDVRGRRSMID